VPYSSKKQRRFMWAKKPKIAEKWRKKGHGHVAVKKAADDWSSVDDPYEEEREEWLRENPEPKTPQNTRQSELGEYFHEIPHTKWGDVTAARKIPEGGITSAGHPGITQHEHNVRWEEGKDRDWVGKPKVPFDIKVGDKGSWWTKPNSRDIAQSYGFDDYQLALFRGEFEGPGIKRVQQRNEGEGVSLPNIAGGVEAVPEMFMHHDEPIPRERLVPIPTTGEASDNAYLASLRAGLPMFDPTPGPSSWPKTPIKKMTEEESRQTELGEYDWQFPSTHGDVSKVRVLPERYLKRIASEGIKPLEQDPHQLDWEGMQEDEGLKQFDLKEPGTWWTDPTVENIGAASTSPHVTPGIVGLRGNVDDFKHQHRGADKSIEEIPETYIQDRVPPERLVRLPYKESMGPRPYGYYRKNLESGEIPNQIDMARQYGFPEEDTRGLDWKEKNTGEPMEIAFQLLKAQQTLPSYDRESIEDMFDPENHNIIMSSKPGSAEGMSEKEQSERHDRLLSQIGELKDRPHMKIITGRGKSEEWGDENSIGLSNIPDHLIPRILELADEHGQDSVLHSPSGTGQTEFLKPSGETGVWNGAEIRLRGLAGYPIKFTEYMGYEESNGRADGHGPSVAQRGGWKR